jgi:hypothetical protein
MTSDPAFGFCRGQCCVEVHGHGASRAEGERRGSSLMSLWTRLGDNSRGNRMRLTPIMARPKQKQHTAVPVPKVAH